MQTSGIITAQFLNYILNTGDYACVKSFGIDETYFPGFENEFRYITEYYEQSQMLDGKGVVPDKVKFGSIFPNFPFMDTGTEVNLMFKELHEAKCYNVFAGNMYQLSELSRTDSVQAINTGKQLFEQMAILANSTTLGSGTNIYRQAGERLEDYKNRIAMHGLLGIRTGHKTLDETIHGWLPEDFVVIIARTNEGKSWILCEFVKQASFQGKYVAVYSGEMSALMYGYRFDTLNEHFGNTQLISGNISLGDHTIPQVGAKSMTDYQAYCSRLSNSELPGVVVFTPKDLNGRLTIGKMQALQDKYHFDMWAVDQISLMEDERKGKEERIRYSNLSEDLFGFSEKNQVPVVCVHQAKRAAAERRRKDENAGPELDDAYGADAISQNATRQFSFMQVENGARLTNTKNRYGKKGDTVLYNWQINYGIFEPIVQGNLQDSFS